MRTGMEDDSGSERVAGLVTEPGQMTGVGSRHRSGCLDLDPDQMAPSGLDKQIYLPAALLFPQMVQARVVTTGGDFGAQLRGDEGVEEAAQHVGAVQDGFLAEPQDGRDKRRVDQ